MVALLDVNLLVALAWPNHVHHAIAQRWFARQKVRGWATCPLTQSGFVRVSSNRAAIATAVTPREAVQALRLIVEVPGHVFWTDDVSLATSEHVDLERLLSYRQVTDAHLLALALRHDGRLATLDRRILALVPPRLEEENAVELLV